LKADLLVTTEQLAAHLGERDWIVFDVRHDLLDARKGPAAYAAGHVPGAYFLHVDDDLSGFKDGTNGRHPLPPLDLFARRMNARGVAPGRMVVAYDDGGGMFASRLWWMLRWLGHERVALLDGGFAAWRKEGRAVNTEVPAPREGSFIPRPRLGGTVDAHYVAAFRESPTVRLIDARAPERFSGAQETIDPVAGHIPGAVNRFWQLNLGSDGRFKPASQLRAEFLALLGDAAPNLTVHQCGSGVTACHNIFAMELAGFHGSRLYPGSWSEWCADPARPVATGSR
jgi:thiosulfate/3-mercaptopyruvate sulfurtransferase